MCRILMTKTPQWQQAQNSNTPTDYYGVCTVIQNFGTVTISNDSTNTAKYHKLLCVLLFTLSSFINCRIPRTARQSVMTAGQMMIECCKLRWFARHLRFPNGNSPWKISVLSILDRYQVGSSQSILLTSCGYDHVDENSIKSQPWTNFRKRSDCVFYSNGENFAVRIPDAIYRYFFLFI